MELISLTTSAFVSSEGIGGLLSAVAAQGVLCSGEGLRGGGSLV
jgi:hypothetical protein